MMTGNGRRRKEGGQTRQEVMLIGLVCAVALAATLSVFVPVLRQMWVGIGRAVGIAPTSVVQPPGSAGNMQENR